MIERSKAYILIVFGHAAKDVFQQYLRDHHVIYDTVWLHGEKKYPGELPYA